MSTKWKPFYLFLIFRHTLYWGCHLRLFNHNQNNFPVNISISSKIKLKEVLHEIQCGADKEGKAYSSRTVWSKKPYFVVLFDLHMYTFVKWLTFFFFFLYKAIWHSGEIFSLFSSLVNAVVHKYVLLYDITRMFLNLLNY